MSTFAYGRITAARAGQPGTNTFTTEKPGVGPSIDTLAGLIPAEVLAAHAVILGLTTKSVGSGADASREITDASVLEWWGFWGLLVAAVLVYVAGRMSAGVGWNNSDYLRMFIPAASFAGWAMIQTPTGFDVAFPTLSFTTRSAAGVVGALVLAAAAAALAYKANAETPTEG